MHENMTLLNFNYWKTFSGIRFRMKIKNSSCGDELMCREGSGRGLCLFPFISDDSWKYYIAVPHWEPGCFSVYESNLNSDNTRLRAYDTRVYSWNVSKNFTYIERCNGAVLFYTMADKFPDWIVYSGQQVLVVRLVFSGLLRCITRLLCILSRVRRRIICRRLFIIATCNPNSRLNMLGTTNFSREKQMIWKCI